ncbi:Protein SDA1 homolog [Eumeta japonica]|uniref:Protein SDA1 n=1 Tax=Eumeta variegata TaxID=151549 RepID=A0A4C1W9G6_EUMVA|nr:Protein SDA1 homolog [Eumeta japonica]
MVASLKFFLGKDEEKKNDNSDSDEEIDPRDTMISNKFNKKTRKREKMVEKVKKIAKKMKKKRENAPVFNFSALHLINNPQGFAEKLFKQIESSNERFEVKLMTLDVISRLIGLHNLFLFNFYPFVARLLLPHQRDVTRILQFAAQAAHELVPSEVIDPVMKAIANNFITERNSTDVMAVGLNAVREICARCPLAIDEDLLRDLVQYKSYKEKSVMMAARSLIQLYRTSMPKMLHKKDRGRPTEISVELKTKKYGETDVKDYIPGSEVLLENGNTKPDEKVDSKKRKQKNKDESDSDEWVDVPSSDSEIEILTDSDNESSEEESDDNKISVTPRKILKAKRTVTNENREEKVKIAREIAMSKIFDDEDFQKIENSQITKHLKGAKRSKVSLEECKDVGELVDLASIENIHKKRKHDKTSRLESVQKGREDREKFGYKDRRKNIHCSKTNREKRKTKNYQMVKHKAKAEFHLWRSKYNYDKGTNLAAFYRWHIRLHISSTPFFLRVQVRDRVLTLPHARASSRRGYNPDGPVVMAPFRGSKLERFPSQPEIKRSCQWVHRHHPRQARPSLGVMVKWWVAGSVRTGEPRRSGKTTTITHFSH